VLKRQEKSYKLAVLHWIIIRKKKAAIGHICAGKGRGCKEGKMIKYRWNECVEQ